MQELPERLIFLNGAPGSGKTKALDTVRAFSGIQTAFSMSTIISQHNHMKSDSLKSMSGLCGDDSACSALASTIRVSPLGTRELIIDGFPRSDAQVRFRPLHVHISYLLSYAHFPARRSTQCLVSGRSRKLHADCEGLLYTTLARSIATVTKLTSTHFSACLRLCSVYYKLCLSAIHVTP